jgi:hypothetical protein
MIAMIVPALIYRFGYSFIKVMNLGMTVAAYATAISFHVFCICTGSFI